MPRKISLDNLLEVINDYGVKFFFYLLEASQEMVGVDEYSKTLGTHEPGKARITLLNRDYMSLVEQEGVLLHEIGHGVRPKDDETTRRYGDSVGYYGIEGLVY